MSRHHPFSKKNKKKIEFKREKKNENSMALPNAGFQKRPTDWDLD